MSDREQLEQSTDKERLVAGNGAERGRNGKGRNGRNGRNGHNRYNGHERSGDDHATEVIPLIPQARARLHPTPPVELSDEEEVAKLNGAGGTDGHERSGGDGRNGGRSDGGEKVRLQAPRPVRARVANGNGAERRHKEGQSADTVRIAPGQATARLRDTDLTSLRLRLKTSEWAQLAPARSRRDKRPLPYFLMRHRIYRARARVGHTRSQVAAKRYGKGGAMGIVVRLFLVFMLLAGMLAVAGVGAAGAGAAWYLNQLPSVKPDEMVYHGIVGQTSKIYDRKGRLLFDLVDEDTGMRQEVTLDQVSPLVISATIAVEDASFYTNMGVDPIGIARAAKIELSGEGSSGGSTITQQLVRRIVMDAEERSERTLQRKLKEAVLAVQMTREYSKDEILEMYLNEIYYGHRAYGIAAASLTYFGKSPKELTLGEAALLAGLPQAPDSYDPVLHPESARARQRIVLDLMVKQGMISSAERDTAWAQQIVLRPYELVRDIKAPHFVYYVKEYLEKKYGTEVSEAGLRIYTTLDLDVQAAAEQVARERIEDLRKQKATNASIVIMNPRTGEILAMVGSVDYYNQEIDGQVNVAIRERQPGSSFKPITFASAFKKGWTPATVLLDVLTAFPNPGQKPYTPKNYDGRDHGWVSVREALANSYNIPAVKALQYAGIDETIQTAHDMGIKGLNRGSDWYGLSLTLGGGEVTLLDMTTAYSTFARGGKAKDANPILKIEDPQGRVIEQLNPNDPGRDALDPRIAYMITDILSDNRARTPAFGPNSPLRVSFPAAAKTGTTDDNRDSWTLGYTPNLTVGVWVGNSDNSEMLKVTGAIGAAVVWNRTMEMFYKNPEFLALVAGPDGQIQKEFTRPEGLIRVTACSAKGNVQDWFLKEAPPKGCTTYKDKNKQLRQVPQPQQNTRPGNRQNTRQQPQQRPTPIPGIWFPEGGVEP